MGYLCPNVMTPRGVSQNQVSFSSCLACEALMLPAATGSCETGLAWLWCFCRALRSGARVELSLQRAAAREKGGFPDCVARKPRHRHIRKGSPLDRSTAHVAGAGRNPDCKCVHFPRGPKYVSSALLSAVYWKPLALAACIQVLFQSKGWICLIR